MPEVSSYPLLVMAADSIDVMLRFQPTSFGSKSGRIYIYSNAAASPQIVDVSGNAPSGTVAVTGSTCFGGVKACSFAERTIAICNVGDCSLRVSSVAFRRKNPHWSLINNPFPATLHPSSCLSIVVRYKATERIARACELVISSDDPANPVKTLELMAYTVWNECGCRHTCEDCQKGRCQSHHDNCACEERNVGCCYEQELEQP